MADILEGSTGHTHYAPLSHAQTVAISRHLQDQIRQLQAKLDEFQQGLEETNDAVADLRKNAGGSNSAMLAMQDGLANTNAAVDANRNELARTNGNVQRLQASLDAANDNAGSLRDAQKVTNANVQKLAHDLLQTNSLANKLQEAIERKLEQDLVNLRDELSRTNLDIKHIRAEQDTLKANVHEDREALRDIGFKVKAGADSLAEANTHLKILEQRVADNTAGLKAARLNFEDLNTATVKLHEDHENTKAYVTDLHGSLKKVHTHVKQVHGKLEATATGLHNTQGKLDQQIDTSESIRQNLEHTQNKVQTLKEGHDRAATTILSLHRELAEVGATTQAVKAGLKEQSSLLLPNINMDSPEARMASARHGSLLVTNATSFMGMGSPKKTPRAHGTDRMAPKEMAWT